MNLLKANSLTSDQIADKLSLSKQDTRTYLLRLKKQEMIKTLGKRGRQYIYTYNTPEDSEKSDIDTNMLVEVLKDYLESEPSFKSEVRKKIAELEAKLNNITSKTNGEYDELAEELEMLQSIEPSDKQKTIPEIQAEFLTPDFISSTLFKFLLNAIKKGICNMPVMIIKELKISFPDHTPNKLTM